MSHKSAMNLNVVVAGDINIDCYYWQREPKPILQSEEPMMNCRLYKGLNIHREPGGAIVVSKLIKASPILKNQENLDIDIKFPELSAFNETNEDLYNKLPHATIELSNFSSTDQEKGEQTYRVKSFLGFTTPYKYNYIEKLESITYEESVKTENAERKNIIVLHDIGNGFRSKSAQEKLWPKEIRSNSDDLFSPNTVIIYYMSPPLFKGDLWDHLQQNYKKNVILIVNAEELRNIKGVNISYSLSWERTALDFLWEITKGSELQKIKDLPDVIICFGFGGAIYYNGEGKASKLYFYPKALEGRFWNEKKNGSMKGFSSVFVSSLVHRLIDNIYTSKEDHTISDKTLHTSIDEGIKYGLLQKQKFVSNGYGSVYNKEDEMNNDPIFFDEIAGNLFEKNFDKESIKRIQDVQLPDVNFYKRPDQHLWKIMEQETALNPSDTLDIATNIVKKGLEAIIKYPIGSFGNLITVDRAETESFRSIMNIMTEYINSGKTERPLSIAVFGAPGSGKSFGIIEIANSIDKDHVEKIEFNVSQFTSTRDLVSAFHIIRDCSLKGRIPIVFFDEFDCSYQGKPLGWLRYFLVPMQDGKFLDHGIMHPIGKSIFVFAGGVYEKFSDFCESTGVDSNIKKDLIKNQNLVSDILPPEKCPDFVSRLRGYVNILGLNPADDNDKRDGAYIIRRAILLRSLIEKKAPCLITNTNGDIKKGVIEDNRLDQDLLELLLKEVRYKHETRSMEAILDMSLLGKYQKWNLASLPSKEQLELHIEVESSILENYKHNDKIEQCYRKELENNSKNVNLLLSYIILSYGNGQNDKAKEQLEKIKRENPTEYNKYCELFEKNG